MKTKTSFGKFAELYDAKVGEDGSKVKTIKAAMPIMFAMLGKLKGKRIYEIACGNGFLARQLVAAGAEKVYASDVSAELISIAKNKYGDKNITYSVREGSNITGLPKNYFDAVVINQGIFYIHNLDAFFKSVFQVLKPGGILIYNVHHPLLPVFKKTIGEDTVTDKASDIIQESLKYPKNYTKQSTMKFKVNNSLQTIRYPTYKRPLSTYINAAAKHKLLVSQIVEPSSNTLLKGKVKKSLIPSYFIIKAQKM